MTNLKTIAVGTAGLAMALAAATPAAAQYYPQQQQGGVVGAIVNAVTGGGYGQYPMGNYGYQQLDQRTAVQQCAAAAEQRVNGNYRGQGYGASNGYNGYQNRYGQNGYQAQGNARVVGITSIERRQRGALRVHGLISTGGYAQQGYNGYRQQGYGQAAANLAFSCKVTLQGQVSDLKIGQSTQVSGYRRGY
jgi:hypothetical protein